MNEGSAGRALDTTVERREVSVDETDLKIIRTVDEFLRKGLALKSWYDETFAKDVKVSKADPPESAFAVKFDIARAQNRATTSFGFFETVRVDDKDMPVIGNYQEMFFDQPGVMSAPGRIEEWREQVREFALHYFMRISSFTQPASYINSGYPDPSHYRGGLSWCVSEDAERRGFGFEQLYYKSKTTGQIFRFPDHERFAIVNLKDVGVDYEWIVLRVRIFDFSVRARPVGPQGIEIVAAADESSYLVVSRDFIVDRNNGPDGTASYGFGYAFIRNPTAEVAAYGPGEFDAAFETMVFKIAKNGNTTVQVAFTANKPTAATSVSINPVEWGFHIADLASAGLVSKYLAPLKDSLPQFKLGSFDPVYAYISLANAITAGQAAAMMCISRDQLNRKFLLQHFAQHYQTLAGTLLTWRQIPDWTRESDLPLWVRTGGLIQGGPVQ